jgi:lipid-binding SYLF domain-containing protein
VKHKLSQIFFLIACIGVSACLILGSQSVEKSAPGPGIERIEKAIQVIKEIVELPKPEEGLPALMLRKCQGLAVFPGVIKAAYGLGGQYGRGIVMIKSDKGDWSHPAFVSLIGGSIGWQIGVQKTDIILVFKTRKSIENIASGKVTLGADVSVAAGPVGRHAEADTDLALEAEIYSYSKSKGLFAGISFKGASIQIDRDANSAFYSRDNIPAGEILHSGEDLKAPGVVEQLKKILAKYSID